MNPCTASVQTFGFSLAAIEVMLTRMAAPKDSGRSAGPRLFHTIVVVGVNLGANVGCGGQIAPAEVATDADAGREAIAAAFCDVAWPTTKGNKPIPACIDPSAACTAERVISFGPCVEVRADGCLAGEFRYPNCRDGAWVCPPRSFPVLTSQVVTGTCSCPDQYRGGSRCVEDGKGGATWEPAQ